MEEILLSMKNQVRMKNALAVQMYVNKSDGLGAVEEQDRSPHRISL